MPVHDRPDPALRHRVNTLLLLPNGSGSKGIYAPIRALFFLDVPRIGKSIKCLKRASSKLKKSVFVIFVNPGYTPRVL